MDADGGALPLRARLKAQPEDFVVEEVLGFAADGSGEHDLIEIEKRGANSAWVADQLARHAGVAPLAVGYAGLKDRHAVTRQFYSVQLPGRSVDWQALQLDGVRVLGVARHGRKLKRGAHRGNRFSLVLREVEGAPAEFERRLGLLAAEGAPNRFGEQRFGRGGGNDQLIERLAGGARLDRAQRGFALSAARARIFNAVLDARVARGDWQQLVDGELVALDGSASFFGPAVLPDAALEARCAAFDVHPSGPLWGRGEPACGAALAALERQVAAGLPAAARVLEQAGLRQERRALRMRVADLEWQWLDAATLQLRFGLARGCYATALVARLLDGEAEALPEVDEG